MGRHFDDLLAGIGEFGPWQWRIMALTYPAGIFLLYHHLYQIYGGAIPDHWCSVPELQGTNWTVDTIKRLAIPRKSSDSTRYSNCQMYQRNYSYLATLNPQEVDDLQHEDAPVVNCHSWQYDTSIYTNTIATEWNLVCDKLSLLSGMTSWYMAGVLIGSVFFGDFADRYGRRLGILFSSTLLLISCICSIIPVNFVMLVVSRFFVGMSIHALCTINFLLVVETISDRKRTKVIFIEDTSTAIGRATLGIIAYFLPDWRQLLIAFSAPSLLAIGYYWCLPESPRWLVSQGRTEEAQKILEKGARLNGGRAPTEEDLVALTKETHEKPTGKEKEQTRSCGILLTAMKNFLIFAKTPEMRSRASKNFFLWFAIGIVTYGTAFAFLSLPIDPFLIHVLNGTIILIVRIGIIFFPLPDILGRRICFSACFLIGGASELLILAVPQEMPILGVVLALSCSIFVSLLFTLIYQYTAELFPTEARNTSVGLGSMVARIGAMTSPFVVHVLGSHRQDLPCAIFGSIAVAAGFVCLLLPETKNQTMPDTVEELEELRRQRLHK